MSTELTPQKIFEMARSFMPARIILTAHELQVFPSLRQGPVSVQELAKKLGCSERGLDRLLSALVALGLLEKNKSGYSLTDIAKRCFLPDSPDYLAGLDHANQMWETWSTLTQAVRRGGRVAGRPMVEQDTSYFRKFISAMHANASPRAEEVVSLLDLTGVERVIDVGGGSGAYAAAFARRLPAGEVILFDLPQVIEIAPEFLARYPGGEHVKRQSGDMLKDEFPSPADLIWLSAIIHMFSPQENQELLVRCARALKPGGRVAIQDFVMDENRVNPPAGAIFALNMLVARDWGDTYTEHEIRSWLEAAGFHSITRRDTSYGQAIMMGTK
jgi:SAM-dependent methyltransferase/biotin operon repressor